MEEGERFMIREEENVSEEGVKGSEKAAIGANQNKMDKARVGRVRLVCKCVPRDPPLETYLWMSQITFVGRHFSSACEFDSTSL